MYVIKYGECLLFKFAHNNETGGMENLKCAKDVKSQKYTQWGCKIRTYLDFRWFFASKVNE